MPEDIMNHEYQIERGFYLRRLTWYGNIIGKRLIYRK